MCPTALTSCPQTRGASYLVWTFLFHPARPKIAAFWSLVGQRCVSAAEPRDTEPRQAVALSLEDFRRLPLPPGGMHVQPGNGQVLVQMPTNVYVTAEPIRLRTEVLGMPVDVEATPDSYTWDFGDGGQFTTKDAGAPYPAMTTTHTYTRPGRYTITLTVNYRGQFRPQGMQDWLPVEGTAPVDSAPVTLEAIETRAVLVP
ncbi:MAG: PKD domain-containing protein [Kineosporiaceae bacterium]